MSKPPFTRVWAAIPAQSSLLADPNEHSQPAHKADLAIKGWGGFVQNRKLEDWQDVILWNKCLLHTARDAPASSYISGSAQQLSASLTGVITGRGCRLQRGFGSPLVSFFEKGSWLVPEDIAKRESTDRAAASAPSGKKPRLFAFLKQICFRHHAQLQDGEAEPGLRREKRRGEVAGQGGAALGTHPSPEGRAPGRSIAAPTEGSS